ncbi:Uncharacterized protein SCF082_LOCUS26094 [Durusdinium trenchii]
MKSDGCFSCSGRPKTFVKSVTINEREYVGPFYDYSQRHSTTVDLEHERDKRYNHIWYRTQTEYCGCCWV